MKDLHIHIERGNYTVEWIEKFINQAVKMNINEINLLEHTIRIKEFHPCFEEAQNYNSYQKKWVSEKKKTAVSLAEFKELQSKIQARSYPVKVNFGLEVCYFEQHEDLIGSLLNKAKLDYVLGSVHWVDNWTFNQRKYQWLGRNTDEIYKRYFELEISAAKSGMFNSIAHPDLIMCHSIFPKTSLEPYYGSLCDAAKSTSTALEMNTSRYWKKSTPFCGLNPELLKAAGESGVLLSTGSDAHRPEDVGKGIKEAEAICRRFCSPGL